MGTAAMTSNSPVSGAVSVRVHVTFTAVVDGNDELGLAGEAVPAGDLDAGARERGSEETRTAFPDVRLHLLPLFPAARPAVAAREWRT